MKKYRIENLDCANCAMKMEDRLNSLDCVKSAKVVFATKSLFIDTDDMGRVRSAITDLEPDAKLTEADSARPVSEKPDYSARRQLAVIISYIAVFAAALVWIKIYPEKPEVYAGYGLLALVYVGAGGGIITSAFKNITRGRIFDENFLMTFATVAAFFIGAYAEAVAVMLFYRTGEFFQELAVNRSRRSIKSLLEVRPDYANVIRSGQTERVYPAEVASGETVAVRPGEKVPLDGVIIKGKTSVDLRAITGESVPRGAAAGDEVPAGAVNLSGFIEIKVTRPFGESSVSKILELVENAASNKARTENFITVFARYYTPAVFAFAVFVAAVPPLLGFGDFREWIYRALVVLVVSCPCALLISVPLGYFGGIGRASKRGILVKGANYLEALGNVKAAAFDKTGTVTKGVFKVTGVYPYNGFTKEEVMKYAALAEAKSNHPIAVSIKEAEGRSLSDVRFEEYEEIGGHGVRVTVNRRVIMTGNDRMLHKFDVAHESSVCNVMGGVAHVAVDGEYAGYIVISDELKEGTAEALAELRKLGVKNIAMLTGDNGFAAQSVAAAAGFDKVYSDLLPEDKAEIFASFSARALKNEKSGKTIYVGDGVNDAPVLASADVGISMGKLGSDAAIETADVVIMDDSVSKIAEGMKISRRTKTIIWQNIIFAISVKLLFVVLGLFGVATIWEAVFGDVGVALIALFNSMRILRD